MVAVAVVGVAALQLTGPYTLDERNYLGRVVDLAPGTYSISGDWDEGVLCNVLVEGKDDLLLDRYETVYKGPLSEATEIVIPEDAASIHTWRPSGRRPRP